MGYLARRPDPADGRAKLIDLTKRGRDAMADAGDRVADIERRWSKLVGAKDFAQMCRTMQRLLDELDPSIHGVSRRRRPVMRRLRAVVTWLAERLAGHRNPTR